MESQSSKMQDDTMPPPSGNSVPAPSHPLPNGQRGKGKNGNKSSTSTVFGSQATNFPHNSMPTPSASEQVTQTEGGNGAKKTNYRTWSSEEEAEFINAMKMAKLAGYKSPQGFKNGAMTLMLNYMKEAFPGTDLCVQPHIKTKLKTWSALHKSLLHMHEQSGIGWCPVNKKFNCTEETWKFHAKGKEGMAGKFDAPWPFYEDWCDIYGKDRAKGKGARAFDDAINKVMAGGRDDDEAEKNGDEANGTEEETDTQGPSKRPRRGNNLSGTDVAFVDAFKGFVELTKKTVGTMQTQNSEYTAEYCRLHLWEELKTYPGLTTKTLVLLGRRIAIEDKMLQYFFTLPKEARFEFITEELRQMPEAEWTNAATDAPADAPIDEPTGGAAYAAANEGSDFQDDDWTAQL